MSDILSGPNAGGAMNAQSKAVLLALTLLAAFLAGLATTVFPPLLVAASIILVAGLTVLLLAAPPRRHHSLRYELYIRYSPLWHWRAYQCKRAAKWVCQRCGRPVQQVGWLEAHHRQGYDCLYHEQPGDLQALCSWCHAAVHGKGV